MPRDSDLVVDRQHEQQHLVSLLNKGVPQLVLVYGRRRVGKTHLLNRTWTSQTAFYFTAAETTPAQNREALLTAFAEWSGESIHPEDYPTWRAVFRLLLDHRSPEPLVITIDEFQYLGNTEREVQVVASELNAAWEMRRPDRSLLFILSGSAIRTLERLNAGGSPLYGRFAWQHRLRPFNYWYAAKLAGFQDLRDRAYAYGIWGGTPRYLAAIDSNCSLADNVQTLMLEPSGEVRELVRTALLQEQGLRDITKYGAILRAMGQGQTLLNEIAQSADLPLDTALRDKLDRLINLDYVRKERNLGSKKKDPFRYRVSDPAFRFYYDFVAPLESVLAHQRVVTVWDRHIAPRLDTYMGLIFETIAEEAYYRLQESLNLPLVKEWGRWEGYDRRRESLEIDIASQLVDGRALTGSVKWHKNPIDVDVHLQHLSMIDRLAEAGVGWAHAAKDPSAPLLYVSAGGFTDRFRDTALASREHVYLWTLEDIYQPL